MVIPAGQNGDTYVASTSRAGVFKGRHVRFRTLNGDLLLRRHYAALRSGFLSTFPRNCFESNILELRIGCNNRIAKTESLETQAQQDPESRAKAFIHLRRPASAIQAISDLYSTVQNTFNAQKTSESRAHLSQLEEIRALAFLEMREIDEALACIDRAIFLDPLSSSAYVCKGRVLLGINDLKASKECLQVAIEVDPCNIYAHYFLTQYYYRVREPDLAIETIKRALSVEPNFYEIQLLLAAMYEVKGDFDTARDTYLKAISLNSVRPEAQVLLAQLYILFDKIETAEKLAKDAIKKDPKYSLAWSVWACTLSESNPEMAREAFDRALELDGRLVFNLESKAYFEASMRNWEQVIRISDEVLKYYPSRVSAYCLEGRAHYHLVHYDEAQFCFDKAIELDPSSRAAYQDYFEVLQGIGQYDRLLDLADQSLHKISNFPQAEYARATTYALLGEYEKAIKYFQLTYSYDPQFLGAYLGCISCLLLVRRVEEAEKLLIDNQAFLMNDLVQYHLAWHRLHLIKGNTNAAMRCLDIITETAPKNDVVWLTKGNMAIECGDYDKALMSFERFLEANPENSMALIYKGDAYFFMNRYDEALACYDSALRKGALILPLVLKSKIRLYNALGDKEEVAKMEEQLRGLSTKNPENVHQSEFMKMSEYLSEDEMQLNEQRLRDFKQGKLSFDVD